MTFNHILEKIQQGDKHAFDQLFLAMYQPLCRYAFSFVNDWEEAEEVVQTMFLHLWENRNTLVIHKSIKSYLYSATHNSCVNRIKHFKVRDKYLEYVMQQGEHYDASDGLIAGELKRTIEKSIAGLPDQRKLVFCMSRFEGLKYYEIAEKLDISVKTVEAQMGKALRSLREALKDYLPVLAIFMDWV